mgnify:CR=1 FL=1
MVFVDYEYWFYSYKNKYNLRPDTAAWRAELEKQFDIEDIMIFADFSSPGIGEELAKLRNITNTIIETGTATQYRRPSDRQHRLRTKRYDGFCYA